MCFSHISARFTCAIDFFLSNRQLLDKPVRGDLILIMAFYIQFCSSCIHECPREFNSVDAFRLFLEEINGISANALHLGSLTYGQDALVWISIVNLEILKEKLGNGAPSEKTFSGTAKIGETIVTKSDRTDVKGKKKDTVAGQLLEILSQPLYTSLSDTNSPGFDCDMERLRGMLVKPTAMTVLGIERAKLLTEKKPFYEVCEVAAHNQTLSNLCLNAKAIGLSVQDLPSNAKTHKVIQSCKSLFGNDVLTCVKNKIHYLPLVTKSTDLYLGNCSYLDTCHKLKICRYLHFYTLNPPYKRENESKPEEKSESKKDEHIRSESNPNGVLAIEYTIGECFDTLLKPILPPQWINCDVRTLPFNILGKFSAIISDPAWDIHMTLPYGTCKDSELLSLPMAELQDEGILLLWVTGRSIEIGRKALDRWGYTVSDEVIWIKLNQLRRTIVTGRTGHWLNHSKEHLLLGIKGNPVWLNRKVDSDIIVSGTRETLRKPDELYGMVERMVGRHSRKLEIFGRDHNIRPGWFSKYNRFGSFINYRY